MTHSYSQRDLFAPIFRVRPQSSFNFASDAFVAANKYSGIFCCAIFLRLCLYKLRNGKCAPRTVFQVGRNFGISEERDLSIDPVLSLEGSGIGLIFR